MLKLVLRPLTIADVPAAIAVHRAAFGTETTTPIGGAGGWTEASLASSVHHYHNIAVMIAEQLAGFIVWQQLAKDEQEILTLAIDPAHQRQGIAKRLIEHVISLQGKVLLEVAANNEPAIRLYKTLGFTEQGRRFGYYPAKYYPGGVDAVTMMAAPVAL